MKWIKVLLLWFCLVPLALVNEFFREKVMVNIFGVTMANAFSGIVLSVLIFVMVRLLFTRIHGVTRTDGILAGVLGGVLFALAVWGMAAYFNVSTCQVWNYFNPFGGHLWILAWITTVISPYLTVRLDQKLHDEEQGKRKRRPHKRK